MTRALELDLLGRAVDIHAPEPLAAVLSSCFGDLERISGDAQQTYRVSDDEGAWVVERERFGTLRYAGLDSLLEGISTLLNGQAIRHSPTAPVLHASAVEGTAGAIVFAALSFAGKSTLAAGLTLAGFRYLGDEAIGLDADFRCVAYPKPLSLRSGLPEPVAAAVQRHGFPTPSGHLVPGSRLGSVRQGTSPIAALVFHQYAAGEPTSFQRVSSAEALTNLTENALDLTRRTNACFRDLERVARVVPAYRLRFDNLDDAAAVLRPVLESG